MHVYTHTPTTAGESGFGSAFREDSAGSISPLLLKLNNSWLHLIHHTHSCCPARLRLWLMLPGCQAHAETGLNVSMAPVLNTN